MKTIKHAAIKLVSGEVITGKSHAHCFEKIKKENRNRFQCVQGFVDSDGEYVSRFDAAIIAQKAGQLPLKGIDGDIIKIAFSEDFWSKEHGGQYDYDEEKGYYKKEAQGDDVGGGEEVG